MPLFTQAGALLSRNEGQLTPYAILDNVANQAQSRGSSYSRLLSAVSSFIPIAPMGPFTNDLEFEHLCNIVF